MNNNKKQSQPEQVNRMYSLQKYIRFGQIQRRAYPYIPITYLKQFKSDNVEEDVICKVKVERDFGICLVQYLILPLEKNNT